jgi:hypothetical protein
MLVYYDDQSNPSTVPGLYTKLLDADKADRVISGYVTHMVAPAMPGVMQHRRVFLGLPALATQQRVRLPKLFLDRSNRRRGSLIGKSRRITCAATHSRRSPTTSNSVRNYQAPFGFDAGAVSRLGVVAMA